MVHAEGGSLIDGNGRVTRLRALAFTCVPTGSDEVDLTERDYQRAADMGFSSIRLDFDPLRSGNFDSDLTPWLDQQLTWAKVHGLQVVLAASRCSTPSPSQCDSDPLWSDAESQERWLFSWRAIAQRYAEETAVAGYDLLTEPSPSVDLEQWRALASQLVGVIREADQAHLVIFEQAQFVACTAVNLRPDQSLTKLDDPNVLYTFEARGPSVFTKQGSSRSARADGGSYPDLQTLGTIDWQRMTFRASDFAAAPELGQEETAWTEKKHYYSAINPSIVIAQVNLRSANNRGTVYFDGLKVEELDERFDFIRTIVDADLEDAASWFLWEDPARKATGVKGTGKSGHPGRTSITLSGTTSEANLNNDPPFIFPVREDYTYRVTGWMKGEHIDREAASMIGLSLWSYDGDLPVRNAANLAASTQLFVAWGKEHGVPISVSAFGTSAATFEPEKGGLIWVSDMLDVLDQAGLGFCYDAYQGADFGIYPEPGAVNQSLVDLFTLRLLTSRSP